MSLADELLADLEEAAEEDEQEQLQEMMRIKAEQDIKEEQEDEPMPEIKGNRVVYLFPDKNVLHSTFLPFCSIYLFPRTPGLYP